MLAMKYECAIIGGGVAGLAAAIRLTELGMNPLLIEAGNYPSHKICGEFFSPSSLSQLEKWELCPQLIHDLSMRTTKHQLRFPFPSSAGSLSHYHLDAHMAQRAQKMGTSLLTHTKVEGMEIAKRTSEHHQLKLSDGTEVEVKHLIIATGRIPSVKVLPPATRYIGFKTHFSGLSLDKSLEMFSLPGSYLGVVPLEKNQFNLAGLACYDARHPKTLHQILAEFSASHPLLNEYFNKGTNLFVEWMQTMVPEFGIKSTPAWLRTYFIGDACATIPPASGNGLTLALHGGVLAAEYLLKDDPISFKKEWHRRIQSPIFFAKLLHKTLLHPAYGNALVRLNHHLPIASLFFDLTR